MAATLKLGDKIRATQEGSLLAYNDENNNFKPLPFDFTRASSATRVNKQGLIETVASGVPRIDFTDANGALLLEPQRTNSLLQSNQFDTTWTIPSAGAILDDNQNGIYNTTDAWKLIQNTNTGYHYISQSVNLTGDYVYSIYAKKAEYEGISFFMPNPTTGASGLSSFNLTNGNFTADNHQGTSENLGNGWYRISLKTKLSGSDSINTYVNQSTQQSETGNGTSGIYIQNAQLELGYATSYIPTQGSAVTRIAETCTGAGNDQVINSTEGVLYAEISALADDGTKRYISLSDGTNNNDVRIYFDLSNNISVLSKVGGNTQVFLNTNLYTQTEFNKIAFKYKENDFALWINGVEVATDLSGVTNTTGTLNQLAFNGNLLPFYGKTKDLQVFTTALTDAELQALTTI